MAADVSLSRDKAFQAFALGATLRHLQACQASELLAAIVTGTGKSKAATGGWVGVVEWGVGAAQPLPLPPTAHWCSWCSASDSVWS
jgi:hypothetical protein